MLCTVCSKKEASVKYSTCPECREKRRLYSKERVDLFKKLKKCLICRNTHEGVNKSYCPKCVLKILEYTRARNKNKKKRKKDEG